MNRVAMVWVGDGIMDTITGAWAWAKRPVGRFFRCSIASRRGQNRLEYAVLTETRPNPSRRIPFSGLLHSVVRDGARGNRRETRDDHRTEAASNARGGAARPGAHRGPGVDATPQPGRRADDHRGDRRRGEAAGAAPAGDPGGRAGRADLEAVQAGQPGVSPGRSGDRGQGSDDRRRPPGDDCRPVRDRERAAAHGGGGAGQGGGGQHPPRRGIQAAHQPVQLPRAG